MSKSLKVNMLFNALRGMMGIFFPLISFPYISRVLGVEILGQYNFSMSIISFALLLSGLGISTYAIREGSKIRNDKQAFSKFASEMFSIHILSAIATYLLLFLLIFIVPKLRDHKLLILILSLQIIFGTIGFEWIYTVFEDFAYITLRSIAFQIISLFLLFLLVKTEQDVWIYAFLTILSSVGSNIVNFLALRKYTVFKFTFKINWKEHINPILILFSTAFMINIYVSTDTVILGFLWSDVEVGIYSVSMKVYIVVKTLISSIVVVGIPRLSGLVGKKSNDEFDKTAKEQFVTLLTAILPAITGILILRKEIILLISGQDFMASSPPLIILAISSFFSLGAYYWGQSILIPLKEEKRLFFVTTLTAILNIVLNFFFIHFWKEIGAASATLICEFLAFSLCYRRGRRLVRMTGIFKEFTKVIIGCSTIYAAIFCISKIVGNIYLFTLLSIILSILTYLISQILLKNATIIKTIQEIVKKFKKNNGRKEI